VTQFAGGLPRLPIALFSPDAVDSDHNYAAPWLNLGAHIREAYQMENTIQGFGQEHGNTSTGTISVIPVVRSAAAVLGILTMLIGLFYATRIFSLIYGVLKDPDGFQTTLGKWITVLGGDQLDIVIAGSAFPLANILALGVLGGGAIALVWIAMGFVYAGGRTLFWALSDQEAIKRILTHALGAVKTAEMNKALLGGGSQK